MEQNINRDVHGKEYNRLLLIIAIITGSFIAILNQTILTTALPNLMNYFKIEASTVQWVTTAYMLTNGIMIPLTALLLEKVPTKKLFMFSMLAFGLGTLACALSSTFELLLVGRVIQAIGAGIMMPLINTVFLFVFPKEKRGFAMGLYGLVISFAPAIGPTLAGLVIDRWDWNYLFYLLIPIIVFDVIFSYFFMKDIIPSKNPKIDVLSIMLSTLGFGPLLYGFSSAGSKGWGNPVVIITVAIGLLMSVLFVWRQLSMKNPMLELHVFKSGTFTLTTIVSSILSIAQVGASVMLPIFLQNILGKSAFESGLIFLPGALLMAVVMMISGRIFDKIGAKKLVIPGITLLIIASIPFANMSIGMTATSIAIFYSIRYIGIGLVSMPLQTEGMNDLDNKLMPHATATVNMTKQISGSLGTAVLITMMSSFTISNAPNQVLAKTNLALYKSQMLDATIKGMNTTFIYVIAVAVVALLFSSFLKSKKHEKPELEVNIENNTAI
ncbi:DHA2 family efflux MFS transporter permease subunit [Clostridium botulinum]|nr:DHA2 family efflux MFS transporter permease subunit [Clostridium botulinum]MBY6936725.1 DHA2 family efflux MFS transporter permease subunit [Clostridium botulinum]MBY6944148.1 DHA2 family efflux MFS transporter permease subunit [Clostridium botulinum]